MLYVLESPSGPANCKEYFYSGVIEIKNHIALVQGEGAKTYLYHLGFRYLGDIEKESDLDTFLARRDPSAKPGDSADVNYKKEVKRVTTVEVETVLDGERDVMTPTIAVNKVIPQPLVDTDLPSAGEEVERWWDKK